MKHFFKYPSTDVVKLSIHSTDCSSVNATLKCWINEIYTFRLIVIAPLGACIMPAGGGGIGTVGGNLWSPRERGAIGGGGGHGGGGGGGGAGATGSASCDVGDDVEANVSDVTLSELLRGLVAMPFRRLAAERSTGVCMGDLALYFLLIIFQFGFISLNFIKEISIIKYLMIPL